MFKTPTRVWINQPSTLQPFHKYHGLVDIAHTNEKGDTYIYFTEGNVSNFQIDVNCLETKNSNTNCFKFF